MPVRSAGWRLCNLTGLSVNDYLRTFDRVNLLHVFPGKSKKEDCFPMTPARNAAMTIRTMSAGRRIVCVGRQVMNAFGMKDTEVCTWYEMQCGRGPGWPRANARIAWIPHTSGQNRFYNDKANVALVQGFLSGLLTEEGLPIAVGAGRDGGQSAEAGASPT